MDVLIDVVRFLLSLRPQPFLYTDGILYAYADRTDIDDDQGTGDNFYKQGQLLPENFEKTASENDVQGVKVRYQPDYDHSYYTMASFADEHVDHAAKFLFA